MARAETNGDGAASVHLTLQGKGGVGKSFVSSILVQYFQHKQKPIQCFDTDPVNATLAQYAGLHAEHLQVLRRGSIHEKDFDRLVERACTESGNFVVDTGATTFLPLWRYVLENEILGLLAARGRRVFIHCVVAGGQGFTDTLNGFERLAETTGEQNLIVWLNEFFGQVDLNGKSFEELDVTRNHAGKLLGSVLIPDRTRNTFGDDVEQMLKRWLTFEEAIRTDDFSLVSKQRLEIVRRDLFAQLDQLPIV
jgi:CobQ/CobB/MinD/ParA nucleotide binding domain